MLLMMMTMMSLKMTCPTALYFKCNQQNGTKMSLDEYLGLVNHEEIPNELE
jgi:hypothetical protein